MTRDQIREVFLAHGFTVKEGQTDLKPYVYAAAEALLAKAQRQKPEQERVAFDIQKAMQRAYQLGQKYWADADSESYAANKRADKHRAAFEALCEEVMHAACPSPQPVELTPAQQHADELLEALRLAESGLADIGDADREPGDDLAWRERRAAEPLPQIRAVIAKATGQGEKT